MRLSAASLVRVIEAPGATEPQVGAAVRLSLAWGGAMSDEGVVVGVLYVVQCTQCQVTRHAGDLIVVAE